MSGEFKARTVEPGYIKRWFVDSIELMSRAFIRNTVIAIAFMLPAVFLVDTRYDEWISLYYYFAAAIMIPLFTVSAEASDLKESFSAFGNKVVHGCIQLFLLLLIVAIVMAIIANTFFTLNKPEAASVAGPAEYFLSFRPGSMLLASYSIFLIMGTLLWFLPVLCTNATIKTGQAILLGVEALGKNPILFVYPWFVYLIASAATAIIGASGIPIAALIGVMMYVSYKDVFLGQGINRYAEMPVAEPASLRYKGEA